MKNELQREALENTQLIVEEWYMGKTDHLLPLLDKDASWIGAAADQFYRGRAEVAAALERVRPEILPCRVSEGRWDIADCGADYCLCLGQYIWTIRNEQLYTQEPQRASFLWKRTEAGLRISHMHVSNVMHTLEPDEAFPLASSRRNYDYVQQKLQAQSRFLQIMTTDYTCHMIGMRQVTHIEAARECLLVHCEDGTVYRVHAGIRGFVGDNCPDFVFVHRSFAVNADHIRAVTPEEVFLTNGVRLPASRQRYKAICEKLREKFK